MLAEVPVVIKSGAAAWPAMEKWANADYLREVAGHRLVPVELGPTYLASGVTPFTRISTCIGSLCKQLESCSRTVSPEVVAAPMRVV